MFIVVTACFIYVGGAIIIYSYSHWRIARTAIETNKQQYRLVLSYAVLTLIVSFLTYFINYDYPNAIFWDENYHIASAEKYIQGVYFQEPHPPLGKMLIAAGELLLGKNKKIDKSEFVKTDHINKLPDSYSFAGVRFTNTLAVTLSALLMYLILVRIVPSPHFAFLLNGFFLFDNAMIVHNRSAMLEGFQIFIGLLAIWYFMRIYIDGRLLKKRHYFILSLFIGLGISVKLNSIIFCLLLVFLAYKDYGHDLFVFLKKNIRLKLFSNIGSPQTKWDISRIIDALAKVAVSIAGILFIFFAVFYVHFSICRTVVDGRYYHASALGKEILASGNGAKPTYFFTQLNDYFAFIYQYEQGVPRWDPLKKGENGSPAYGWPFGNKSINYRWDKVGAEVRYVYLQGNPVIWYTALIGIILAIALVTGKYLWGVEHNQNATIFSLVNIFVFMYVAYMAVMIQVERVMYLYHYFIPLVLSFIVIALVFSYLFNASIVQNKTYLFIATLTLSVNIIAVYIYYSPLSYHEPLTYQEFMRRNWSSLWQLTPIY